MQNFTMNMLGLFIITFVAATSAEFSHNGPCPELKPVKKFNVTEYQGVWYEISKLPTDSESGNCGSAEYKLDGNVVKVKNSNVLNGVQSYIEGTAKFADETKTEGKLVVTFKFGDFVRESPLAILKTDYTNYAIAYTCKYDEQKNSHRDYAWILSRSKMLDDVMHTNLKTCLKEQVKDIDISKLLVTDFSEEACKFTSSTAITTAPGTH